jgi:hypothetical protein
MKWTPFFAGFCAGALSTSFFSQSVFFYRMVNPPTTAIDKLAATSFSSCPPCSTTAPSRSADAAAWGAGAAAAPCADMHTECLGWAAQGECQRNPVYMAACAKTCGLCGGAASTRHTVAMSLAAAKGGSGAAGCTLDKDASCKGWAAAGECPRNPAYMQATCGTSCCNTSVRPPGI